MILHQPLLITIFDVQSLTKYGSQRPGDLSLSSVATRFLILCVRILQEHGCCVLPGTGLCDELIIRTEESYRLRYVVVCGLGASRMRRPWLSFGYEPT